jgi:hypothetical protein
VCVFHEYLRLEWLIVVHLYFMKYVWINHSQNIKTTLMKPTFSLIPVTFYVIFTNFRCQVQSISCSVRIIHSKDDKKNKYTFRSFKNYQFKKNTNFWLTIFHIAYRCSLRGMSRKGDLRFCMLIHNQVNDSPCTIISHFSTYCFCIYTLISRCMTRDLHKYSMYNSNDNSV